MEDDSCSDSPIRVFWGPLTLEEIKVRLAFEKPPEMIERRATISEAEPSRTIYSDSPTADYLIKKHFFGTPDDMSASFVSKYFTPNETLNSDKNAATSSVYVTLCESLESNTKDENPQCNMDESMQPGHCSSTPNRSLLNGSKDRDNLIKQMSNTLNLSSRRSSLPDVPKFSLGCAGKTIRESQCLERDADAILVSSDDDYDNEHDNKPCEINSSQIYIISSDNDSSFEEEQIEIKSELNEHLNRLSMYQNEMPVIGDGLVVLKSPEISISESFVADKNDSAINLLCDQNNLNVVHDQSAEKQTEDTSSSQTNQSSSSMDQSSGYCFNDTLDEMEMALQNGLDYTMPEETSKTDIPASDLLHPASTSKVTPSKSSPETSSNKPKLTSDKTKIPIKTSRANLKTPIKSHAKQDFEFRMPSKPASIRKTPDFKHILSPVAVYIKNSPQVPQVQHVSAKPFREGPLFPTPMTSRVRNKENEELPTRIYKPAKRAIVSEEKEIKLPGSVQKYLPNVPVIIKHEGRVGRKKPNESCVEEKLLKEDLTMCESDASLSNSLAALQDISLHTVKKAYIN